MTQPLRKTFHTSAKPKPPKYPSPFSLRFSEEERAILRARAGKRSIGEYIRGVLFGSGVSARKVKRRNPSEANKEHAAQLAGLGQSRLASNMNQIAKAAHMGALPVTPDLVEELWKACEDIRTMRRALVGSLGLKAQE
ncbi:hypothetical protein AWH62_12710 [Maricaulis sp. W15]|uniref:hypothetical protein n=1 Tax=Maricaulis sp. W15 TaxID=1772333 RepID=UPI00094894EB|nr:hypothetical protein [Maricaulis sp. W15]OLF71401.1 hypothetical protein AWH62_12710 [Maricaulis sp. W15]